MQAYVGLHPIYRVSSCCVPNSCIISNTITSNNECDTEDKQLSVNVRSLRQMHAKQ